jgi:hypothetical protein
MADGHIDLLLWLTIVALPRNLISGTFVGAVRQKDMEYRGIEFSVVKSIERRKWRWNVAVENVGSRSGVSATPGIAAAEARRAISWLLAAKNRELEKGPFAYVATA